MSRFIFDLTDDDRSLLEGHRIRLGLRSGADALRALIRGNAQEDVSGLVTAPPLTQTPLTPPAYIAESLTGDGVQKWQEARDKDSPEQRAVWERLADGPAPVMVSKPQTKPQATKPFASRLKGAWKAP